MLLNLYRGLWLDLQKAKASHPLLQQTQKPVVLLLPRDLVEESQPIALSLVPCLILLLLVDSRNSWLALDLYRFVILMAVMIVMMIVVVITTIKIQYRRLENVLIADCLKCLCIICEHMSCDCDQSVIKSQTTIEKGANKLRADPGIWCDQFMI